MPSSDNNQTGKGKAIAGVQQPGLTAIHQRLRALFPLGDLAVQRPDLTFVELPPGHLRPALLHLRDREGFSHLVLLTAVDWLEVGEFQLTYLLCNRAAGLDLGLRVRIPRDPASMASIHDLWPTAATYQRELREMFGIDFPGSPRLQEDFILEGWREIPPYRRDFNTLEYARQAFAQRPGRETLDPATHMQQQLYPPALPRAEPPATGGKG
ncbi:MAG: NADH-quinone oxidoreductase subunit C [Chromatiaceae bacterium]|nr:NADH-quinone oxidoreductase subunit C [Chromatiaceae bacterium]